MSQIGCYIYGYIDSSFSWPGQNSAYQSIDRPLDLVLIDEDKYQVLYRWTRLDFEDWGVATINGIPEPTPKRRVVFDYLFLLAWLALLPGIPTNIHILPAIDSPSTSYSLSGGTHRAMSPQGVYRDFLNPINPIQGPTPIVRLTLDTPILISCVINKWIQSLG